MIKSTRKGSPGISMMILNLSSEHTSQDLCLDFSRLLPCHIREFLCQKWGQALTNKSKNRWRSHRSSWSLILLLRVHLKSTRVRRVQSPYWFLFRTQFSLAREAHARAFIDSGVNALYLFCIVVFWKARASRASERHILLLVRSLSAKYRPDRYRRDKSVKFGTELA